MAFHFCSIVGGFYSEREGGRESEVVLQVGGNAVAAKGMLGVLNPLGSSTCRSLADSGARVPKILPTADLCLLFVLIRYSTRA